MHMAEARRILNVQARWDSEARVWVALSDDIPGLVAEAASLDDLFSELDELIPALLELNGATADELPPFQIIAANKKASMEVA